MGQYKNPQKLLKRWFQYAWAPEWNPRGTDNESPGKLSSIPKRGVTENTNNLSFVSRTNCKLETISAVSGSVKKRILWLRDLPFHIRVFNPGSMDEFQEVPQVLWNIYASFCVLEFSQRTIIFIRFLKGSVTQKIKNHCSRVFNPVTISGASLKLAKEKPISVLYLPHRLTYLLTSLLKLDTEMRVCALENSRFSWIQGFLQLQNKANHPDSPNKSFLRPLRKEVVKKGRAEPLSYLLFW